MYWLTSSDIHYSSTKLCNLITTFLSKLPKNVFSRPSATAITHNALLSAASSVVNYDHNMIYFNNKIQGSSCSMHCLLAKSVSRVSSVSEFQFVLVAKNNHVLCSAVRLTWCVKYMEHITPALRSLHWLPLRFGVNFKILTLVYTRSPLPQRTHLINHPRR